ncbi:MAG: hypothetical protein IPK82_16430 [Polyangiaceae bacterium]|nr:hypothetical protein [Polyangiaceae bacterium]
MLFTLEALNAGEGDCLLLTYGTAEAPHFVLIDGGPGRICQQTLLPRVNQIRTQLGYEDDKPLPIDLCVVTHVDEDHVEGIVKLFQLLRSAKQEPVAAPVHIKELWHNSFDDVLSTNQAKEAIDYLNALPDPNEETRGVTASIGQGKELRDISRLLDIPTNLGFKGLVARPDDAGAVVDCGKNLVFTVIGPNKKQLLDYQKKWDQTLSATGNTTASTSAGSNPFNLASIAMLAEMKGTKSPITDRPLSMLLTGDANGDELVEGLKAAGKLAPDATLTVDLIKLAHHGSNADMKRPFFERVLAPIYVVSANGKNKNPDAQTLDDLAEARGNVPYKLVCTFEEAAYKKVKGDKKADDERREALKYVEKWAAEHPNVTVIYRPANAYSIPIALGDEHLDDQVHVSLN